jgi:FkbM family methyltransferase
MNIIIYLIYKLNNFIGKGYGVATIDKEVSFINKFINNPQLVVDIGANKGLYSSMVGIRYKDCEIHLFEPSLTNFKLLLSKFNSYDNFHLNNKAVSNFNGNSILHFDYDGSGLASLSKRRLDHFNIDFSKNENIECIIFDDYWKNILKNRIIDVVKIDVEGHELEVLLGMREAISSIRIIQFEFGGCNIDTRTYFQDFWYFFKSYNFKLYRISPFGLIFINKYSELDEYFITSNYFAINLDLIS